MTPAGIKRWEAADDYTSGSLVGRTVRSKYLRSERGVVLGAFGTRGAVMCRVQWSPGDVTRIRAYKLELAIRR